MASMTSTISIRPTGWESYWPTPLADKADGWLSYHTFRAMCNPM
jgi:hypothetical protein